MDGETDEAQEPIEALTLEDLLIELKIEQTDYILEPFHQRITFCLRKLKEAKTAIKTSQEENLKLMREILQKEKTVLGEGIAIPQQRRELYLRYNKDMYLTRLL